MVSFRLTAEWQASVMLDTFQWYCTLKEAKSSAESAQCRILRGVSTMQLLIISI
jgi:hypothetical protein